MTLIFRSLARRANNETRHCEAARLKALRAAVAISHLRRVSLIALLLFASTAIADESPEAQGLAIAHEMDLRDQGFQDYTAELEMTLRNKNGDESIRNFRVLTLELVDDGDKSLAIFDRPADIKGTALLTFTHKQGEDDQWLYLPALKRVKRISSSNQSGPFMGSEFAYEDLSSQEVEKYTYKFLRDEDLDGRPCFVIERYPVHPKSGYTRQVVWVRKDIYHIARTDFYDRKDALLKTYVGSDYQQFLDKHWRATTMTMENHQTGKSTQLRWNNFQFKTGLSDRDFDQNSLARAR